MKTKTQTLALLGLMPAALLILASCSTTSPPPPARVGAQTAYAKGVPGGVFVQTFKTTATVTAVDQAKRQAILLGSDGKKFTVKVGPEAINFDQVHVGDQVNALLTEQLVVALDDQEAPADTSGAALVALAAKGAPPGGLVAETVQVIAKVVAIDEKKRTATLQFDDGSTKTFPVREDIDLSRRKVGERVVFRVTEIIALNVEKPR